MGIRINSTRLLLVCCLFLQTSLPLFSQYSKFWIQFSDKNNSPYSVLNPSQFLSARSILRRVTQNIPIVQNDLPVNPSYIDSIRKVPNVIVLNKSKWFNAVTIYTKDTNALNTIKLFPFVHIIHSVMRFRRKSEVISEVCESFSKVKYPFKNDSSASFNCHTYSSPEIESTVGSFYNYGLSYNQVNMIGGVCLHNMGYDGKGIQIAILDVGFDRVDSSAAFDSLRKNNQILGRWNFVDGNSSVTTTGAFHGTWCLSLMAGNIPGKLIGTAPKAKYWLLRTEDDKGENVIEEDNWVSGAEFADSVGADVLSTSLGYAKFDSVQINGVKIVNPANHSYSDMNGNTTRITIGTDIAASKGMLPVCAAGNSGDYSWHFIAAPADADSVLAVGALDSLSNYVSFSSKGPSFDGRVKPNVAAQGAHPYTTDLYKGAYNMYSGTSFACPLVAGMVACLWQAHPAATNMELLNAIQQAANRHSSPDTLTGYGVCNFCAANLALSVNDNLRVESDLISIYPNPFSSEINVRSKKAGFKIAQIEVENQLGEKVYQKLGYTLEESINLSFLPSAIYFIKVKGEEAEFLFKIIKY